MSVSLIADVNMVTELREYLRRDGAGKDVELSLNTEIMWQNVVKTTALLVYNLLAIYKDSENSVEVAEYVSDRFIQGEVVLEVFKLFLNFKHIHTNLDYVEEYTEKELLKLEDLELLQVITGVNDAIAGDVFL